jgi:Dolichyl-phosphate-mannose-protein mannosyltransferase
VTLTMNVFEPVFWMVIVLGVLQLVRAQERGAPVARWWLLLGVTAGIGLENKWNEVFFLVTLLVALVVSPQRRVLASRWLAVCVAIIAACALPNVLWEVRHHWPTLQWLHNDATEGKNIQLGPLPFLWNQMFIFGPLMAPLWITGIGWLLFGRAARSFRWAGIFYVLYLPLMILLHAKDYYLAPIYPLYFAAGAAAWDGWMRRGWQRRGLVPAYAGVHAVCIAALLPMMIPFLPPAQYIAYMQTIHMKPHETQTFDKAPLPQYYADMLGWPEMANKLADAYWSLPPAERAKAVIYGTNYGEASAVNVYRPDVPTAISAHQNYFFWGPRGHHGEVMIIIGDSRATDEREFDSVEEFARTTNPYVEPYERRPIFICRGLHEDLYALWPQIKFWY